MTIDHRDVFIYEITIKIRTASYQPKERIEQIYETLNEEIDGYVGILDGELSICAESGVESIELCETIDVAD